MADDIEAELKAAGKELDKVRYSCPTICYLLPGKQRH